MYHHHHHYRVSGTVERIASKQLADAAACAFSRWQHFSV